MFINHKWKIFNRNSFTLFMSQSIFKHQIILILQHYKYYIKNQNVQKIIISLTSKEGKHLDKNEFRQEI